MGFRTSYSQNNTYIDCSQHWYLKYKEGWEGELEGSSLYFGSAIDVAVGDMLEGKQGWLQKFYDRWHTQYMNNQPKQVFDNDKITFTHKDFDPDVLEPQDFPVLEQWAKELNLIVQTATPTNDDLVALFRKASKDKANPYVKLTDEQFKYFNRCSWLSLKRKGKILLNAFKDQFMPKVKKVIAVQKRSKIQDTNTGDEIIGYIDMILEIDGYDKPIIFDLKTSSFPYDQHKIEVSPQLTMYSAMEAHNHNTDLVGYVVLNKNIPKDEVSHCSLCNHQKNGRHKSCDALKADGTRCGGSWIDSKIPNPQVQVMVAQKTQAQIMDLLKDCGNIILAMKNEIVYKNTNKCTDWYGGTCIYYDLCHKGKSNGLVKKK